MKKKILSIFLSLILIISSAIPAMARDKGIIRGMDIGRDRGIGNIMENNKKERRIITLGNLIVNGYKALQFIQNKKQNPDTDDNDNNDDDNNDDNNNDNNNDDNNNDNNNGNETQNWITYTREDYGYSIKYPENGKVADWAKDNPSCIILGDNLIISINASDEPAIYDAENDWFGNKNNEIDSMETKEINKQQFKVKYYLNYMDKGKTMEGISAVTEHNGKYYVITAHHLFPTEQALSEEETQKRLDELKNGNEDFVKIYWEMAGTLEFAN